MKWSLNWWLCADSLLENEESRWAEREVEWSLWQEAHSQSRPWHLSWSIPSAMSLIEGRDLEVWTSMLTSPGMWAACREHVELWEAASISWEGFLGRYQAERQQPAVLAADERSPSWAISWRLTTASPTVLLHAIWLFLLHEFSLSVNSYSRTMFSFPMAPLKKRKFSWTNYSSHQLALTTQYLLAPLSRSTILNSPCPCLPPLLVYMVCLVGWASGHPVFLGPCQCTAPFTIIIGQRNIKKWPLRVTCISEWFPTVLATHCLKIVSFHFSWHWYVNIVYIFIMDMAKRL